MYKYKKKGEKRKQRGNYRFYNNLNDYITYTVYTIQALETKRISYVVRNLCFESNDILG